MQNSNNQGRKGRLGMQFQYEQSFMNKVVADYMAGDQSMNQVAARYLFFLPNFGRQHWKKP
jgi:hypothetical protein